MKTGFVSFCAVSDKHMTVFKNSLFDTSFVYFGPVALDALKREQNSIFPVLPLLEIESLCPLPNLN